MLRLSEIRYRRLFETAQDGILLLDAGSGRITDVNPFMIDMLGYPREHFLGRRLWEIGPVKDEELSRRAFLQLQEKRYVRYEDLPLEAHDGRRIQVEFVSNVYAVGDGEVIQCNIRDISARRIAEAALEATTRKIAELHRVAHDLETSEDEDGVCRMAIETAEKVLGFVSCSLHMLVEDKLVVKAASSEAVAKVGQEVPIEGPGGGLAATTVRAAQASRFGCAKDTPGSCPADLTLHSEICVPLNHLGAFEIHSPPRGKFTEEDARLLELLAGYTAEAIRRIRLHKELKEQATRDPLTGAYNRRYFTEVIAQGISRAKRHGRPIGFLMIDVNRFRQINDQLGHLVGDRVLQEVGALLRTAVRGEDFVIRYGGDEFLMVLPETNGETDVVEARILEMLDGWNETHTGWLPFPLSLAIGNAHWLSQSDQSIEEALAETDRRMYERKREDRQMEGPGDVIKLPGTADLGIGEPSSTSRSVSAYQHDVPSSGRV